MSNAKQTMKALFANTIKEGRALSLTAPYTILNAAGRSRTSHRHVGGHDSKDERRAIIEQEMADEIEEALKAGGTVEWDTGIRKWRETNQIITFAGDRAKYTWNEAGSRVKAQHIEVTLDADNVRTERHIRFVWVNC